MNQVGHDVVTTADNVGNRGRAVFDQFLGIIQPHASPMRKTRNLQQLRVVLGVRVIKHPPYEPRPEFRQPQSSRLTLDLFFSNA